MTHRLPAAVHIVAAGSLFVLVGLVTGHFSLFFDTGGYVREGEYLASRLGLAGRIGYYDLMSITVGPARENLRPFLSVIDARSPAYSLLLYLGAKAGTFAFAAWLQGLAAAWPIAVATRVAAPERRWTAFWAVVLVLALGSSLPFFVDFAMPDVFGGIAILCAALLLGARSRLGRLEIIALWLMLTFALAAHRSNLGTIAALTALGGALLLLARRPLGGILAGTAGVAVAVVICVVSSGAAKRMMEHDVGIRTGTPPFLTARVLADGPGRAYLQKACPGGVAPELCKFKDLALDNTDKIIWDTDPKIGVFNSSDYATRIKLQDEQSRFVVASVLTDPLREASAALQNWAKQLILTTVDEPLQQPGRFKAGDRPDTSTFDLLLPGSEVCLDGKNCYSPTLKATLSVIHAIVLLSALATLAWATVMLVRRRPDTADVAAHISDLRDTAILILLGVVLNAGVCGIASEPFARYQARLIWLVPMTAVLAAFVVNLYVYGRSEAGAAAKTVPLSLEAA